MHILERYALGCGAKIGKPYIYDKYFPLPIKKYITLQPFSKYSSKCYDYWDDVVELMKPILDKQEIKIVQIGGPKEASIQGCVNVQGQTNIPQCSSVIKNGMMHVGVDSFAAHIASGFGKKIVCMYSSNYAENASPYWTNKEDMVLLTPDFGTKKPSFATEENPKTINSIKPEVIAQAVLDLLGVDQTINRETLYIGETYTKRTFEWLPDCVVDTNALKIDAVICRYDLHQDIKYIEKQLQVSKLCIVTDRPFQIQTKKEKIKEVVFMINKDHYHPDFAKWCRQVECLGIKLIILSKYPEDQINDIKLDFIDVGKILYKKQVAPKELPVGTKIKYKSNRIIVSKGKMYPSQQAIEKGLNVQSQWQFVEGEITEELLQELEYLYVEKA
jgi:hypothetical protein|tara:strand:- start:4722 stop:5882 length:1161 start_codon:yes stop_codon:yes gene_type:complete